MLRNRRGAPRVLVRPRPFHLGETTGAPASEPEFLFDFFCAVDSAGINVCISVPYCLSRPVSQLVVFHGGGEQVHQERITLDGQFGYGAERSRHNGLRQPGDEALEFLARVGIHEFQLNALTKAGTLHG